MASRKKGNWSTAELDRLRTLFPNAAEDRVAALLNRSVASVRTRAKNLFQRSLRRGEWTADDDRQLRLSYGVHDARTIGLVLARSEREVRDRIRVMRAQKRRGPWNRSDLSLLKQLYGSRTDDELEVVLGRSLRQIEKMARELCLSKDKKLVTRCEEAASVRMPRWSEDEERQLEQLYPHHDNLVLAKRFGRSVTSVANKANKLGLRKSSEVLRDMGRKNVAIRYSDGP